MAEIKSFDDVVVGDFLHIVEDDGDELWEAYKVTKEAIKMKCFFGPRRGKKSTLWKVPLKVNSDDGL